MGELWLKLDLSNPTHSFKDRVVAIAAAKAREFGHETLSATSTGNLANAVAARAAAIGMRAVIFCPAGLEPEKLAATTVYGATVYGVRGSYDDCSRLVSEFAYEVDWGIVNVNLRSYYAEGSKTLAFEIAEQLGWETPDAVVMPIGSGAMFTKVWLGFQQFERLGLDLRLRSRSCTAARPRAARPVASAFAEDRRVTPVRPNTLASSIAIGNPADGDLTIEKAKASGGGVFAVPEDEIGANISLLAEQGGIFGEGATGVAIGALREAVRRGELGECDRVVVLVTGTGLKTPQLCPRRAAASSRSTPTSTRCSRSWECRRPRDATAVQCQRSARGDHARVDDELVAAVNRRLELARRIFEHKEANGIPIVDAGREEAMVARLVRENPGPLSDGGVAELVQLRARADQEGAGDVPSRIVCLPGDGIGPEVMADAVRVLEALPLDVEVEEHPFGGAAIDAVGDPLPAETLDACRGGRRRAARRGRRPEVGRRHGASRGRA